MAAKSSVSSRPARLKNVKSEDIKDKRWSEKEKQALRRIARQQAAGNDSQIDFSDIPPLTDEQLAAMVRLREVREAKVPISFRIDARVLAWLKSKGDGHLTRINDILTNVMEAEQRTSRR
ncbi:MAG: BrnA antitoxin family protein [Bryobacteraceae bacterium]